MVYHYTMMTIDTQYYKQHWQTTREQRLLTGLCPRCGKRPPIENRKQCQECIDYMRNRRKRLAPDKVLKYREHEKQWQKENQQYLREADRQRTRRTKEEVISHYGGVCVCCGESNIIFLTIDHIQGNGSKQRKEATGTSNGGRRFYAWLRAKGYPPEFQVLCWNCNCAKGHYGFCPHQIVPS